MIGLALALLLGGREAEIEGQFLKLSVSPALLQLGADVRVGLRPPVEGKPWTLNADRVYFVGDFRERDQVKRRWTDGTRCPAAVAELRKVELLRMPSPRIPLEGGQPGGAVVMDGTGYTLETRSSDMQGMETGSVQFSSNVGTDLAKWADALLAALKPCWAEQVPERVKP